MRSIYALAIAAVITFGFMSCGPSAEEMKKEQMKSDSIANAMQDDGQHMIDSINKAIAAMSSSDSSKKDSAKK